MDLAARQSKVAADTPRGSSEALERLTKVMETLSPHLDPGLTLHGLAGVAGMPAYQLTELLNGVLGQTFYAFVRRMIALRASQPVLTRRTFTCSIGWRVSKSTTRPETCGET